MTLHVQIGVTLNLYMYTCIRVHAHIHVHACTCTIHACFLYVCMSAQGQVTQVTGYLTAPTDSEESYL